MRFLSRLLIIPIILAYFSISLVYADTDNSDCGKFAVDSYSQGGQNGFDVVNKSRETNNSYLKDFLSIDQQKAIIGKDDLNTAVLNLKEYCCEKRGQEISETCEKDRPFFNGSVLDSPYLFDHLFDVIMRRLNGLTGENDIYTKTNMSVDETGAKWRGRINGQAESIQGSSPSTIYDEYSQMWNKSDSEKGFDIANPIYSRFALSNDSFLDYIKNGGDNVADALRKYNERTLYDRYSNSCALAEFFYSLLLNDGRDSDSKTEVIYKLDGGKNCDIIINKQIDRENSYVQMVARRASNLFLSNYIDGYFSYLYTRQQNLQKLWKDATDRFLDVARAVPCLQKVCVK